jgi:hypothetical protein
MRPTAHWCFAAPTIFSRCSAGVSDCRRLTPGALTVTHSEIGEGRFGFSLEIDHPRLGRLLRQYGEFRETET